MNNELLVCTIGGKKYLGNEYEYVAARLKKGDVVIFEGKEEVVDYVWFCDGPIIKLSGKKSIYPSLGETFKKKENDINVIVKFGHRTYVLDSPEDVIKATSLWIKPCDQDQFEIMLMDSGIKFSIYNYEE